MATKTNLKLSTIAASVGATVTPIRQSRKAKAGKDKVPAGRAPVIVKGIGYRIADHIEHADAGGVAIVRELIGIKSAESKYASCLQAVEELQERRNAGVAAVVALSGDPETEVSKLPRADQKQIASIRASFGRYLTIVKAVGGIRQAMGRTTRGEPDSRITADLTLSDMSGYAADWNGAKQGRRPASKLGVKQVAEIVERLQGGAKVDPADKAGVADMAKAVESLFAAVLSLAAPVSNALAFDLGKVLADVKTPRRAQSRRAA